ncbi:unnamed protein product [Linum tenue]|uniref:Uncharacterized protein n=1 Tax=Linum tenue TaxID=586396 RepID=A0AAV0HEE8_9ROSI|nr:unnamed protein product [Linum tenue]
MDCLHPWNLIGERLSFVLIKRRYWILFRMSIARWKAIKTKETGKEPDRLETFEDTHTRKNGTYVNGYTATLIEKAYTLRQEGSFDNEQIFQKVHGPEHPGRVRCAGLGPTPSTYLGPSCSSASINSTTTSNSNEVDALRSEVIELRNELAEAKSEVVELRSGMDQLQMEVDTLKTCSCNIFVGRRGQWRVQFVHYLHQAKVLHGVDKR